MTIYEMHQEILALPSFVDISLSITTSLWAQMQIDNLRPDGMTYNSYGLTIFKYGASTCHFVLPGTDQVTKSVNASWIYYDIRYPDGTRASVLVHLN